MIEDAANLIFVHSSVKSALQPRNGWRIWFLVWLSTCYGQCNTIVEQLLTLVALFDASFDIATKALALEVLNSK